MLLGTYVRRAKVGLLRSLAASGDGLVRRRLAAIGSYSKFHGVPATVHYLAYESAHRFIPDFQFELSL
jgi:hypothetical protein